MKRYITLVMICCLLSISMIVNKVGAAAKEKETIISINDKYDGTIRQVPQQIDCQEIKTDEVWLGGKVTFLTICFYDVEVKDKHLTMWRNVKTGDYGFTK